MNNIIVVPNKKEDIDIILNKDIKGIIIGVKDLSIYNFELTIEEIILLAQSVDKKIIIAMNKMIHNKDIPLVKEGPVDEVLQKQGNDVKNSGVKMEKKAVMDAASQARAQQKAADAKRAEFLGRNGRKEDGSRMGFFERRNAKKYYQNQDWLTNADKYANGEVDINGIAKNNAESGAGWWDGVPGWAKLGGAAVAGGIAGAVLSDD